jgi:hypothetical protein
MAPDAAHMIAHAHIRGDLVVTEQKPERAGASCDPRSLVTTAGLGRRAGAMGDTRATDR